MNSIAIVGAGLIGRLLALSLNRQGYQVTLLDKDTKLAHNSAAYAAAGLLTPLGEAMHSERNIVEMGFESLTLWPEIVDSLDEYTYFQHEGAIMVSHPQDMGDYQRFARYIENYYPEHKIEHLNRERLLELEPEIGRSFNQGIYLPQEGQIGNRKLLVALTHQLEKEGIHWLSECEVTTLRNTDNGGQVSYKADGHEHQLRVDCVVDCRGTGANQKAKQFQLTDLREVRGEIFQLFAPDVTITRPIRLMHPRYQLYIAPKKKGHYVVGATEIESDDSSPMTVRSAMELLSAAYSVHPGFAEANIRQHLSQSRPAFSDNQPHIIANNNVIQVNGLYRHGFLIAPVIMKQAEQVIKNQLANQPVTNNCPYSELLTVTLATPTTSVEQEAATC